MTVNFPFLSSPESSEKRSFCYCRDGKSIDSIVFPLTTTQHIHYQTSTRESNRMASIVKTNLLHRGNRFYCYPEAKTFILAQRKPPNSEHDQRECDDQQERRANARDREPTKGDNPTLAPVNQK
ncbi:hypothetical protein GE21DRAFT_1206756 [Neurospora crassa]|nr:hypothetical protein B7J19.130 [imported] - Neurospora crassa [Neurospora crassa]KHE85230.1 hypothetical protein GE21DRAFT_1206756 [Neurospora crassa]